MRYAFIVDHRTEFPIRMMCRVLRVAPSGYYAWLQQPESRRSQEDRRLLVEIQALYRKHKRRYGSRRITRALRDLDIHCNTKRVARLMRGNGLRAVHGKKYRVTTDSSHRQPVAANLLGQEFSTPDANTVWLADITYVWTKEGWLYLAAVMDLWSRRIIGWAMEPRMTRQLVLDAMHMALKTRVPGEGLMHHSDRGSQYASKDFQALLEVHGVSCSMSRKGNCWDNAVMESFFHTLKVECVHQTRFETRADARSEIFEYIEAYYNTQRMHSALGYLSPVAFEELAKAA